MLNTFLKKIHFQIDVRKKRMKKNFLAECTKWSSERMDLETKGDCYKENREKRILEAPK